MKPSLTDNTEETYSKMPVSQFALQMLTQMGWEQDKGLGKNHKNALMKPVEFLPRPQQAGLGSIEVIKQARIIGTLNQNTNANNAIQKFTEVFISKGRHKDLEGVVLEVLEEQYIVELKCNGEQVKLPYSYVSKEKCIANTNTNKSRSRSCSKEKGQNLSKNDDQNNENKLKWVQIGLRVKIRNKKYRNGKYYNKKITISDVVDEIHFIGMDSDDQVLEDLCEKDIKATLPKKKGSQVILLKESITGVYMGKKDKKTVLISVDGELREMDKKGVCAL